MPMFILTAPFLGLCCEHAPPVERACCYGMKCSQFLGLALFFSPLSTSRQFLFLVQGHFLGVFCSHGVSFFLPFIREGGN